MLKLSKVFLCNKVYCLGLHKPRVCFLWLFIWKGCKIFCQLEHEHSRSYCRVTRLNKLLFLFVLRKINMQCCPACSPVSLFPCSPVTLFPCSLVLLFSCYPVPPLPCFLVPLFPCSPVTLFPCYLCFLVPLFPCSPVPLFPRFPVFLFPCSPVFLLPCSSVSPFPCFLVPFFPCSPVLLLPCSPVTLFPSESVESFPCSSVNLKFFTQMKRPHSSVNGRSIFFCWVSERLISIFHRFWKGPFSRTEMPFLCTDGVRACISSKRSKIGNFFFFN